MQKHSKSGFTLIELSIVLVIIGLIIGSIFVGQTLIKTSQIRQTISQKDSFDAALNTFVSKFNCMPGDCPNASSLGLNTASLCGTCNGNGDGMVGGINASTQNLEYYTFWLHLLNAGLIKMPSLPPALGGYLSVSGYHTPTCPICTQSTLTYGLTVPAGGWYFQQLQNYTCLNCLPVANGGSWTSRGGTLPTWSAWELASPYGLWTNNFNYNGVLNGPDAYAIDTKIDDGMPLTGTVLAFNSSYSDQAQSGNASAIPSLQVPSCVSNGKYVTSNNTACTNLILKANY